MRGFFSGENSIAAAINKAADLLFLNILLLLCCLPVITAGAALTAGHFVALRIKRDEAKVFSDFFRSFRENFGQATLLWLGMGMGMACILAVLWFYGKQSVAVSVACTAAGLLIYVLGLWMLPLLSKFVYGTGALLKNSLLLSCRYLFHTLGMLIGTLLPVASLLLGWYALPFVLLYGLSVPVYIQALLYHKPFAELEEKMQK